MSAAGRLLAGAAGARFEAEGALLLAGAAALAGDRGRFDEPGLALVAAAGAGAGRDELAALAEAVPGAERATVLGVAERLLARIDPDWAWSLIVDLVGAGPAVHAALGLDVAAHAGPSWSPGVPAAELPEAWARQLAADRVARAAVAGRLGRDEGALAALDGPRPGRALLPSEARVLLPAAAAVDPAWGLEVAEAMLADHSPADLLASLRLVAEAAVRAGLGAEVAGRATKPGYASEQATWAAAAAWAGAMGGAEVAELAGALAPRIEDELDPGDELVAGLPLLEALAHGGQGGLLVELAGRWRAPPPLLANQLFHAGAADGASALLGAEGLAGLLAAPEDGWDQGFEYRFCWWTGPGSVRDALAVTAASPWRPLPGSLADLVGWT
jgi:hypothetical protein